MMRAGRCSRFGESAIAAECKIDVASGAGCGGAAHPCEDALLCGAERIVCKCEVGAGEGEWSFAPLVGESDKCFGRCIGEWPVKPKSGQDLFGTSAVEFAGKGEEVGVTRFGNGSLKAEGSVSARQPAAATRSLTRDVGILEAVLLAPGCCNEWLEKRSGRNRQVGESL